MRTCGRSAPRGRRTHRHANCRGYEEWKWGCWSGQARSSAKPSAPVNPQEFAEAVIDEAAFRKLLLSGCFAPHFRKILAIRRRRAKPEVANHDNFDPAITSVAVGFCYEIISHASPELNIEYGRPRSQGDPQRRAGCGAPRRAGGEIGKAIMEGTPYRTLWDFLRTLAQQLPRTSPRRVLASGPALRCSSKSISSWSNRGEPPRRCPGMALGQLHDLRLGGLAHRLLARLADEPIELRFGLRSISWRSFTIQLACLISSGIVARIWSRMS